MHRCEWNSSYSVHVQELDDQHRIFVDALNELYDAIRTGAGEDDKHALLDKLAIYAKDHFATEEKYFDLFDYPEAEEHKRAHAAFWTHLENMRSRSWEDMLMFMESWLEGHVKYMDQKYVDCFHAHGLY